MASVSRSLCLMFRIGMDGFGGEGSPQYESGIGFQGTVYFFKILVEAFVGKLLHNVKFVFSVILVI